MAARTDELGKRLGYSFADPVLLDHALTHRSRGTENNERLEFLGDSVLNFAVSAFLYERFPRLDEGALTRLRASLVNKPTLAALARQIELGPALRLGEGELKSGGFDRDSILADALEAVIGAVFLDAGIAEAQRIVLDLLGSRLERLDPRSVPKDAKTQLQEWLQKRTQTTPEYRVVAIAGEAHNQRFTVECRIAERGETVLGHGASRRIAEQEAAALALDMLSKSE